VLRVETSKQIAIPCQRGFCMLKGEDSQRAIKLVNFCHFGVRCSLGGAWDEVGSGLEGLMFEIHKRGRHFQEHYSLAAFNPHFENSAPMSVIEIIPSPSISLREGNIRKTTGNSSSETSESLSPLLSHHISGRLSPNCSLQNLPARRSQASPCKLV
jgi:hypothetical protein